MNIVIIEDEDLAAESLEKLLLKSPFKLSVKKRLESVEQSLRWFKNNTCDLILSDIHLGDGESFEIFETLKIKTPIIFITAFDEYAIKSFQFFAIDYLLKPFDKEKLYLAIKKYINYNTNTDNYNDKIEKLLLKRQHQTKNTKERFLVTKGDLLVSIKRKDVAYFMAQGKHLFLYTNTGESYLYNDTISNLEHLLPRKNFFKINRQYIIQHKAIKCIVKYSNNRIKIELNPVINTEKLILVSAQKTNDFKNWLNN